MGIIKSGASGPGPFRMPVLDYPLLVLPSNGPFRKLSRQMLVTPFGGQLNGKKNKKNGEFLVFMEAEDSSEGLVKVAVHIPMPRSMLS